MEPSAKFTGDVDKTQIPPLNQKRILAFVNHFLISTCTFLNEFALNCETKFMQMERQLQRTEAALIILEAKLASIPIDNETDTAESSTIVVATTAEEIADTPEIIEEVVKGVQVSQDIRYRKFFKMLQVGVPAPAVKIKMRSEGLEPQLLDQPDLILEDGVLE
ncbi:WASH complex subunit 3 [Drosophila grimshawi]|uniref:GH11612 n=1 Tax=Drosophila grimshawi TaxID=7222 RepID=B4JBZ8_DROGR|nr:WASH complex subunit 3 [Drosophila grimshawi]EDW04101.1 GH11612 [Drosophila grimshawi]